jgi:hypothetical protein
MILQQHKYFAFNSKPGTEGSSAYQEGDKKRIRTAFALINKLKNSESASLSTIILRHNLVIRESSLRSNSIN